MTLKKQLMLAKYQTYPFPPPQQYLKASLSIASYEAAVITSLILMLGQLLPTVVSLWSVRPTSNSLSAHL